VRNDTKARRRTMVILEVQSGQITAKEGARRLGVSRKTYYEWESRALKALMQALRDEKAGRPPNARTQAETNRLKQRIQELEQQVETAKQSELVRRVLTRYEERLQSRGSSKKNRRCGPR